MSSNSSSEHHHSSGSSNSSSEHHHSSGSSHSSSEHSSTHHSSGHHSRHKHKNVYRKKNLISYVLSVFVAICTLVVFWGVTIKTGLFNTEIFDKSINSSGYYEDKTASLTDNLKKLLTDSGIDAQMGDDVITNRMVVLDTNNYISSVMNNDTVPEIDTEELETTLSDKVREYLADNGVSADDSLDSYIERLAEKAASDYKSNIAFPAALYFSNQVEKYQDAVNMLIVIPLPLILICLVVLLLLHRMKYRGIRYLGYGICAASVLEVITSYLMKRRFLEAALEAADGTGDAYRNFTNYFISNAMNQGTFCALAGFAIFGIIIIVTYYCRKKAI